MKKKLLLLSCIPFVMYATEEMSQEEREANVEAARVVKYTVTIYRDSDNYDKQAWKESLLRAIETIEKGSQDGVDEVEFVGDVVRSLQTLYTRSADSSGMHGLIQVGIGDGECPNKCGEKCTCKSEYRGVCPCSAGGDSCRGQSVVLKKDESKDCSSGSCCK